MAQEKTQSRARLWIINCSGENRWNCSQFLGEAKVGSSYVPERHQILIYSQVLKDTQASQGSPPPPFPQRKHPAQDKNHKGGSVFLPPLAFPFLSVFCAISAAASLSFSSSSLHSFHFPSPKYPPDPLSSPIVWWPLPVHLRLQMLTDRSFWKTQEKKVFFSRQTY